jgi:hypothetical protein
MLLSKVTTPSLPILPSLSVPYTKLAARASQMLTRFPALAIALTLLFVPA